MALTQEQLEELVVGKPPNPNVIFYEQAVLDVEASKAAGRRVYRKQVFLKETYPGVTDWTPVPARREHIEKWPEEYRYFEHNRQGAREPGVEMIPGLDVAHLQELRDYGLASLASLAAAQTVPNHLQYAQDIARRIQHALEGANHGNEKEVTQEGHGQEGRIEGHGTGVENQGYDAGQTRIVPQESRRQHDDPVGRPEPAEVRPQRGGDPAGGVHQARRDDGHSETFGVSPNFTISLG